MITRSLLTILSAFVFANSASAAVNLIKNGNAEAGLGGNYEVVPIPEWNVITGGFTVIKWDAGGGYPASTDPGPVDRGLNYFSGGAYDSYSAAYQVTDILDNAGGATYYASGYFGGFGSQTDYSQLTIKFLDEYSSIIGYAWLGEATPAERNNVTGFVFKEISGTTPIGTTKIEFLLEMNRQQGSANDGYADNLFFSITPVPEAETYAMLIAGLGLISFIQRRKKQII
jgi:hypothetical protein